MKLPIVVRTARSVSAAVFAVLLALPPYAPAWAQSAQQPAGAKQAALPDARTIIDRHIKAIGGRDAILSYSSSRVTGRIEMPANGLSGPFEMFAAKPNLSLMRMTLSGIGDMQEGFDGKVGWMLSPVTGPMLTEGAQLEQKRFDSDFFTELKDPSRYESITTVERTTFDGRECYKLRLVSKSGLEDFEYYEVESGLRAGGQIMRETPMGPVNSVVTHSDYRRFGKLLHPATQKLTTMGIDQILTVESVEYDGVDPKVFELPEAIKALIK